MTTGESEINPLGPYTPAVADAIGMATGAIQTSHSLLKDVELSIQQTHEVQRDIHKGVNNGLTKKVAETIAMKVCKPGDKRCIIIYKQLLYSVINFLDLKKTTTSSVLNITKPWLTWFF